MPGIKKRNCDFCADEATKLLKAERFFGLACDAHRDEVLAAMADRSYEATKRIVPRDGKYCVVAETTGRNFGCYDSIEDAKRRLGQIERFKGSSAVHVEDQDPDRFIFDFLKLSKGICTNEEDVFKSVGSGMLFVEPLLSQTMDDSWPSGAENYAAVRSALASTTDGATKLAPARVSHTAEQLKDALAWAVSQEGSKGAVLIRADAKETDPVHKRRTLFIPPVGWKPSPKVDDDDGVHVSKLLKTYEKAVAGEPDRMERFVLGVVLEPEVRDLQKDRTSEFEIRQAAHKFMESFTNTGVMHTKIDNQGIRILESTITRVDEEIGGQFVRKGTWLLGLRIIDDELWKSVRGGDLTGLSMGGSAIRRRE